MLLKIYVKYCKFEEVAYLILNKDLPNSIQLKKFEKKRETIENYQKTFMQ
jgi:2-methylcitrate synthase